MKRIGYLYEKIWDMENLKRAHKHARKGKGWYKEVKEVDEHLDYYLKKLQDMLINQTYKTSQYTVFQKKEGNKMRTIYKLPYFPDRVAQWAIIQVIEPYFLKSFTEDTYSSIPKQGIHKALNKMRKVMHNDPLGTRFCLKMDIKHFYQNIDHNVLKEMLKRKFKDKKLLNLLFEIIDSINTAETEDLESFYKDGKINYKTGIPIGNYLSQYFGNFYLSELDHKIKEEFGIHYNFRYMDDYCIFDSSKEKLHRIRIKIQEYLARRLHLSLKPNYQVFPSDRRGVDFVGYRVFNKFVLLRKSTCKVFKDKMKGIHSKIIQYGTISFSDWCMIGSYAGWLCHCDSNRLITKYLLPILKTYEDFYKFVIRGEKNEIVQGNSEYG